MLRFQYRTRIGRYLIPMLMVALLANTGAAIAGGLHRDRWQRYDGIIRHISARYGIDPRLVHAVIWEESDYDRWAVSSAGAQGLMQLMPETADDLGVYSPFSIRENIDGGVRYLVMQLQRFGSVRMALEAYHCGPDRVLSGHVPYVSIRYANQVIARFRYLKWRHHVQHRRSTTVLLADIERFAQ